MDPDECLRKIREAMDEWNRTSDSDVRNKAANDVAEGFEALDEWLTKGGFMPKAWSWAAVRNIKFRLVPGETKDAF